MAPVERKVKASTVGALVAAMVVSQLYTTFPGMTHDMGDALSVLVAGAVTSATAFAAGWFAKHTPRADKHARKVAQDTVRKATGAQ